MAQVTRIPDQEKMLLSYRTSTLLTSQRSSTGHSTFESLIPFIFIELALTMSFLLIESHQVLD